MSSDIIIKTERLVLRNWRDSDIAPFFELNQDPKVFEFLGKPLTLIETFQFIKNKANQQDERGYTIWATEIKETGELIGYIGLNYTSFEEHFTPAVEVGWRLGSKYWGKGYATEGAKASLDYGFNKCELKEIVSFTVPANVRSIQVMERIGMKRDLNGDFERHGFGEHLTHHILYRTCSSHQN